MTNCHQHHRPKYLFCPNPTCAWPLEPMTCSSCCYLLLHPWKCLWLFLWSMSVLGWHANTFPGHGFSGTSWCISPQLLSAERCTFHRTVSWISCRCHVSGIRERAREGGIEFTVSWTISIEIFTNRFRVHNNILGGSWYGTKKYCLVYSGCPSSLTTLE